MAKGSRKNRRPSDGRGGAKSSGPIGQEGEDAATPPSVLSTAPAVRSSALAEGDEKLGGDCESTTAASVASGEYGRGCEAGSSKGGSAVGVGKGADGIPAAEDDGGGGGGGAAPVREGTVRASTELGISSGLSTSSPGSRVEGVAIPEPGASAAATAAGSDREIVSEKELDASMCGEMEEWTSVDGGGRAPERKATPWQARAGGIAQRQTGRSIPEEKNVVASASASAAATGAGAGTVVDGGGMDTAGKMLDQRSAPPPQRRDGEGTNTGTKVEERSASVEVAPETPNARRVAEETRIEEAADIPEPQAGPGAVPEFTAAPPLDIGGATPVANREMPVESGSKAAAADGAQTDTDPLTSPSDPALEAGLDRKAPDCPDTPARTEPQSTKDALAEGVDGVTAETPAATALATTVPIPPPLDPPAAAITADSSLQTAERDSVDGREEPEPPPSAAPASESATAAEGATGAWPASDVAKENATVDGAVGSDQGSTAVTRALPGPARESADAVAERVTAMASSGGSGRERAAAAKVAAEAATAAAVLASADAASKGVFHRRCDVFLVLLLRGCVCEISSCLCVRTLLGFFVLWLRSIASPGLSRFRI